MVNIFQGGLVGLGIHIGGRTAWDVFVEGKHFLPSEYTGSWGLCTHADLWHVLLISSA